VRTGKSLLKTHQTNQWLSVLLPWIENTEMNGHHGPPKGIFVLKFLPTFKPYCMGELARKPFVLTFNSFTMYNNILDGLMQQPWISRGINTVMIGRKNGKTN
jgi:hypothetical protein